jgi:hypothetical protein
MFPIIVKALFIMTCVGISSFRTLMKHSLQNESIKFFVQIVNFSKAKINSVTEPIFHNLVRFPNSEYLSQNFHG